MRILCLVPLILVWRAADAAEVNHPVYDPNATEASVPSLQAGVKVLMDMTDDEVRKLVPKVNGFRFCGCPNCTMGTQEGQISWKGISDPFKAVCKHCGCEYPNPKYPEDQTKTGTNFKGETVTYRFHKAEDGTEYFFSGRAAYDRKGWLAGRAYIMARAYAVTKDEAYAHKALVLIDALAEAYSHWCVHFDWPFRTKGPVKPEPPFPTAGGLWNRWFYADVPTDLIQAYDLVHDSPQVQALSEELGMDVRKRIEDDLIRRSVWFVRTYKENYSNMSPGIYQGLIVAGRVLGEPEYVHDGVSRFKALLANRFFYDGFWREGSISYHDQTIFWLARVAEYAKGYTDPEGFVSQIDNTRYDDLDLMAQSPLANIALNMNRRFVYPNGHIIPCHDAWARSTKSPLAQSEPWLLPGMGHAVLGCGADTRQTQAHLHFSGGYGHQHRDNLHFSLFSNGHEMLPDLGYTHTKYRAWNVCTPAHNTVAVDEREQHASGHTCNLLLWAPNAGPAQVVEAEAAGGYPGTTEQYRRMIALVKVDEALAYAVDVFRVTGGSRHDYFLHGSADADQQADCSVELSPVPDSLLGEGVEFSLPSFGESDNGKAPPNRNVGYGFIQDLRSGSTDETFDVSFRFADNTAAVYTGTILGAAGTQVVLGQAPSVRRAQEDDTNLEQFKMPILAVRRKGAEGLSSTFVAVHRGWQQEDFIRSVTPLPGLAPTPGAIALVVEHSVGKDIIFSCTEEAAQEGIRAADGGATVFAGRFGIVRYPLSGKPTAACLVGGAALKLPDIALSADGSLNGELLAVHEPEDAAGRFAFKVGEKLEAGGAMTGCEMLITHGDGRSTAHTIISIEPTEGGSLVAVDRDPGFRVAEDGTRFTCFPQDESKGSAAYRIDNVVSVSVGQ